MDIRLMKQMMRYTTGTINNILMLIIIFFISFSVYYYFYRDTQQNYILYWILTILIIINIYGLLYYIPNVIQNRQMIMEKILSEVELYSNKLSSSKGIEMVYNNQREFIDRYIETVKEARYEISILSASLLPLFFFPEFKSSVLDAVRRGVQFKVLIRCTDNIKDAEDQLQNINNNFIYSTRSLDLWITLQKRSEDFKGQSTIKIKTFKDPQNLSLIIVDDTMFFAPYIDSSSFFEAPFFEISQSKMPIYLAYRRLFDREWEVASDYHSSGDY